MEKNIINWYPFRKDSKILEVKEISDLENAQDNEYDYICLIDILSRYKENEKAYLKLKEIISLANKKISEKGLILLAIDNKYGMKAWTSVFADTNILCNDKKSLSKRMIEEILDNEGLNTRKFYYVLPDLKCTNVIFTDEYLPTIDSILRNLTYGEEEFKSFNQTEAYQEILKEDKKLFSFFANSYFVEISKNKNIDNDIKFVSYTNLRKKKYKVQTIIHDDYVEKINVSDESKEHIEMMKKNIDIMNESGIKTLDRYDDYGIKSKFVEGNSYDQVLIDFLKNAEKDKFFEELNKYKIYLIDRLGELKDVEETVFNKYGVALSQNKKEKLNFVKNGLWDLIFQNTFLIDNEMFFYDQEWYEENVPVEFILYRILIYFDEAHRYIKKDLMLEKLGLSEFEEEFAELDLCLQKEIRDEEFWQKHLSEKTGQTLYDLYNNLLKEFKQYKLENDGDNIQKMKDEINELKDQLSSVNSEFNEFKSRIVNSTSWKITKPLRWLGKIKG